VEKGRDYMTIIDRINDLLDRFIISGQDIGDVLFSVLLAAIMGLAISRIYKWTHRGLNYEHTFMATLVLLAPIISVVMLYIRGDLVLSLGLIGSLSIIRFRTPIKDTRDMVFLFWVIAVGLGAGTYNWAIVAVTTPVIAVIVALLYFFRYGNSRNDDFVLVVNGQAGYQKEMMEGVLGKYATDYRVRSYDVDGEKWEIIFELRFARPETRPAEELMDEVKGLSGVSKVSLLAPQLALPL